MGLRELPKLSKLDLTNLSVLSFTPKLSQIKSLGNPVFINCLIKADPKQSCLLNSIIVCTLWEPE